MKWKSISEINITTYDPYGTVQLLFRIKHKFGTINYMIGYVHKGAVYSIYNTPICQLTALPMDVESIHYINPREISL